MPNPKRQHSKQRSRKRRGGHPKLKAANFSACSHCGKPILTHRVCPFCGFYKGKQIVEIAQVVEETKQ